MDNEAGMEHLSRKILREIDDLLLVSDCSARSIEAVARIRDLANEIGIKVGRTSLIVNKAPNGELNDGIRREIERFDLNLLGVVPMDEMIFEYDCNRRPLVELPEDYKLPIKIKTPVGKDTLELRVLTQAQINSIRKRAEKMVQRLRDI